MPITTSANFVIPDDHWEQTGSEEDPESRLLAAIVINGLYLHVEAYAVKKDRRGVQIAVDPWFQRQVEEYQAAQDTAFTTTEMRGREYIIVAMPFGN